MDMLERAIAIAVEAHAGQVDKAGAPYILHPLRVMLAVPDDCKEAAVLHDVVEDCPEWPLVRLAAEGFGEGTMTALDRLTKRSDETYAAYVTRCGEFSISLHVKIADLSDNLGRLDELSIEQQDRLRGRYTKALRGLHSERHVRGYMLPWYPAATKGAADETETEAPKPVAFDPHHDAPQRPSTR